MQSEQQDPGTTNVTAELSKQVSFASELLAEQRWARTGAALSVIHINDKIIEEKEKELVDCIAQNYSRIKGVERELAGLQLQLKLTNGPKKSALELLRRKIELQNEKVVLARGKYQAARKVAEAADEVLKSEETVKERLCQELNLLVQQSAHAQLERLEQLTKRMELLNKGFTPALDADIDQVEVTRSQGGSGETPQPPPPATENAAAESSVELAPKGVEASDATDESTAGTAGASNAHNSGSPPASSKPATSSSLAPASPQQQPQGNGRPRRPEISAKDHERAAAARSKHVTLKSPNPKNPSVPSGRATPPRVQRRQAEPFRGFE